MIDTTKLVEGKRYLVVYCEGNAVDIFWYRSGKFQVFKEHDNPWFAVDDENVRLAIPLTLALNAEKLAAESAMLRAGIESVKGHGVTLPIQISKSNDYMDGYRRGVNSQRWSMHEEMERWREENPEFSPRIDP
jgi:hypothetical protein